VTDVPQSIPATEATKAIDAPEAAATGRGSAGGRAFLVTVDQGLSSITNLLAVLWVAHAASAADFGSFSLVILVYTVALGLVHALVSMRVGVHPEDADHRARQVLGSAVVIGSGWGVGCVVVGGLQTLADWTIGPQLLILGVLLPALTLHDVGRALAVARQKPLGAVILDSVWLAALLAGFVAIAIRDDARLFTLTLAWAGSGALASLCVLPMFGVLRPRDLTLSWLMERWDQSWRLMVGNLTASGSALIGASLIALVSSPVGVAAVRGVLLLGRPTSAVQLAVSASTAVDVARERPDDRGLMRHQRRAMLVSLAVAALNIVVLVLLPDALGKAVLGNVWPVLAPLMLPVSVWLGLTAAQSGVPPVLIGRHQFQVVMIAQILGGVLSVATLVVGAALDGTTGAVWGLAVGQAANGLAWWGALIWHLRRRQDAPALT
jgi:O-antigen/teichoic acid export membrane protein